MILPSGAFCVIRSKHVCYSQDERSFVRTDESGKTVQCQEGDAGAREVWADIPAPLKPRDHHWLTLHADIWASEDDEKAADPPLLSVDPQFGHRFILDPARDVGAEIVKVLDSHFTGGRRGTILDASRHRSKAVTDALGLLNHPHVQALEVTP